MVVVSAPDRELFERVVSGLQTFNVSARELDVSYLFIVKALTSSAIAQCLGVTRWTVDSHLNNAAAKCGMTRREYCRRMIRDYWRARGAEDAAAS